MIEERGLPATDVLRILREAQEGVGSAKQIVALDPDTNAKIIENDDKAQDVRLKRVYAVGILVLLLLQLSAADIFVFLYASRGVQWHVPTVVVQSWLTAAVVQVIGMAGIVARFLFPRRHSE